MKHPVRSIPVYLYRGAAWGCTFFVCFCTAYYFWQGREALCAILEDFPRHAGGAVLVGIGYASTAIVYESERLSLLAKALIHFSVGNGIFFLTASSLGWMPPLRGRLLFIELLIACAVFAVIWSGFYLSRRKEARRINERLRELAEACPDPAQ